MVGYLYGGNTGVKTAAELAREREIVDALIARGQRTPQNLGEGLTALGQAIASRAREGRLRKDEGAAKEGGLSLTAELLGKQPDSPTITPQSEIETGPLNGGMKPYRPEPSLAGTPYPTHGPETPPGPADWQQGEAMPVPEPMASPVPAAQPMFPKTEKNLRDMSAEQLLRFMADPRFEHTGQWVHQMVAEEFKRKSAPVDPMDALNVEEKQLQIEKLRNPPPEKPTDDIAEYEKAVAQGYKGSFVDYMTAMKQAGAQSITVGGTDGNFDKELSKGIAGVYVQSMEAGRNAVSTKTAAQQLRVLMAERGGALDGLSAAAAPYLPEGMIPEGTDDIVAAQAIIAGLVPKQRVPGSGTTSDFDAKKFAQSLPSIWNQPGGNEIILNTMESYADYQIFVGDIVADVGSDPSITNKASEIRKRIQELPDPFIAWKQYMAASAGKSGADPALKKKYGLE